MLSIASATAAAPCAAPPGDRPAEYVTLAEAARRTGLHETTVLRSALAGDVRHKQRGRRTLFHVEDLRRVAG
jgi:hypothetical protein